MDGTIAVILKPGAPEAVEAAKKLRTLVPQSRLVTEKEGYHAVEGVPELERLEPEDLERQCEMVVVLGGDGTLIHAASLFRTRSVPILGINLGTIGFLTEVTLDEMGDAVAAAISGKLDVGERIVDGEAPLDAETAVIGRPHPDGVGFLGI